MNTLDSAGEQMAAVAQFFAEQMAHSEQLEYEEEVALAA